MTKREKENRAKIEYAAFLQRKTIKAQQTGITPPKLHPGLFDFQRNVTEWALQTGRAALFLDTGLGKTVCQLEWARHIPGKVLILAPVAVAPQTVREGHEKLGLMINHSRDGSTDDRCPITITNYERLHLFDVTQFHGVVLDESSILKSFSGKTTRMLCDMFKNTPFRLACSATPAPNDYMELGNHCEFLGVMPQSQMLARFFINDTSDTGTWRLKGHAVQPFWEWVATWAACAQKPSDAGGDDERFKLPPLTYKVHTVESLMKPDFEEGLLFSGGGSLSATKIHADKRETLQPRVSLASKLALESKSAIVWCETNSESAALAKAIEDCVEVVGSDDPDDKEEKLDRFTTGKVARIVTKGSIAGFGLNWQHCNRVIVASLSYSFESFYQEIRRSWRFGQKRPVHVDVIIAESEQSIWRAIREKMDAHQEMNEAMRFAQFDRSRTQAIKIPYNPQHKTELPTWISK